MSVMSFYSTGTWRITSGPAWHMIFHRTRDLTSRAATLYFGDILVAHEHAVVLLLHPRVVSWVMGEISSRTSHCNRTAAISRSELVIFPLGLSSLTAYLVIYYGNCTNQTILGYAPVVIIHTPPAPDAPDISQFSFGKIVYTCWPWLHLYQYYFPKPEWFKYCTIFS